MIRTLFFVSAPIVAVALSSHAQVLMSKEPPPPMGVAHQFDWLTEKWTGDERPYRKMRNGIERSLAQGQNVDVLLNTYTSRALKTPFDPLAQFGRLYLVYKGALAHSKIAEHEIYRLEPVYRNIPSPTPTSLLALNS